MWRYADPFRIHDDYGELFGEWYYWAPGEAAQTEVDFLLRLDRDWIAIEAKGTARVDADQLRGRRAIKGLQGLRRRSITRAVIFGAPLVAGVEVPGHRCGYSPRAKRNMEGPSRENGDPTGQLHTARGSAR